MEHTEFVNHIRLIRASHIGPITCHLLMKRYKSATAALQAIPELSARGGRKLIPYSRDAVLKEIEAVKKLGAKMICFGQAEYPPSLKIYDDAPFVLTIKGHTSLFQKPACAIVGARNASINACNLAKHLAQEIGQQGIVIISGMARGIDRSAHEGAITSGTIAVLANGIDEIYPPENESLYHQIAEQGLLITEMPFGTKPSPRLFPLRNRIIASLSKAVLVVEAALRSGSLITAREAGDRGIDVMAVPGSPLDPRSKGTNGLIREGAVLVQDIEDIMAVINQPARLETPPPPAFDSQPEKPPEISANTYQDTRAKLLKNLSHDPIAVDELCRWCHVSADIAQSVLLELELAGQVQRHSGNRVSRLILNE